MRVAAAVIVLGLTGSPAQGQTPPVPLERDPAVQWLLLKRAYLEVRQGERALDAAVEGSDEERADRARSALEQARLEYGAVLASLVPVVPRLVVTSAIRRQHPGREPVVQIGLWSQPLEWPDAVRRVSLPALDADLSSLASIRGALVTIKNSTGTVIGLPFQVTVDSLDPGERATVRFHLQEITSTIVVALNYAGRIEEHRVRLAGDDAPLRLDSAQASQEADLGATAAYDLRLERTTPGTRVLRLLVDGLPKQVRHDFVLETKPGAMRLSQYRFQNEELVRPMVLRVHLPEVLDGDSVAVDTPLRFRARVADASSSGDGGTGPATAAIDLEVIPRGVGRLTLQSPNYLVEGPEGSPVTARIEVKNVGSRDMQDVKPTVEVPTGWTATVSPSAVPLLRANEARGVDVVLHTGGASAGDYGIKVRAAGSGSSRESSAAADLRVRLVGRGSIGGILGFAGGLLGLVAAVAYVGMKLSRS